MKHKQIPRVNAHTHHVRRNGVENEEKNHVTNLTFRHFGFVFAHGFADPSDDNVVCVRLAGRKGREGEKVVRQRLWCRESERVHIYLSCIVMRIYLLPVCLLLPIGFRSVLKGLYALCMYPCKPAKQQEARKDTQDYLEDT